jgi:hypothetical protein
MFIVLDLEKAIPCEYQKIPFHMVFDKKYCLRHKSRLFARGNYRRHLLQSSHCDFDKNNIGQNTSLALGNCQIS